jgi:hypothetical protein
MTARWQVAVDVVWAGEDTVRLYNAATGTFQTLNDTGSAIWMLMIAGNDADQIARELGGRHGAGEPLAQQLIARDVASFLRGLATQQVITAADPNGADPPGATAEGDGG